MRNEDQQRKAIHYIETNPMKALLCRAPEDWPFSSAKLRDEFCQLEIPEEAVHA